MISTIQQEARGRGVALLRTPAGLGFAAMKDGEVIEPEGFEALPEAERARIQKTIGSLQESLKAALRELSGWSATDASGCAISTATSPVTPPAI